MWRALLIVCAVLLAALPTGADSQAARAADSAAETAALEVSGNGMILRKEVVVAADLDAVWEAWTTNEGLRFVSEASNVELRIGAPYEWFLDLPADENGLRGGEGARVLAFLPREMLAFTWTFPPATPGLRAARATTQVVVLFDETESGVRVRLSQHGWQDGEEWQRGYEYFDQAWGFVLERLRERFATN